MTREEAINILDRRTTIPGDGFTYEQIKEAIDMAISALRLVSRERVDALDLGFDVIDIKTGEYPDLEKIALTEEWARGLVYCDMDGFAVREDGSLILLDECGNCVSCPSGRFEIRLQDGGDKRWLTT